MHESTLLIAAAADLDWGQAGLRLLHILAGIAAAGGAMFQLIAVHPALQTLDADARRTAREAIAARWSTVVFAAIAILLVTGLVNFLAYKIPAMRTSDMKGLYHGLFGVKLLLALAAFHAAAVLALPGPRGERYRDKAGGWLRYLVALLVLVIVLGVVLRTIGG